MTLFFKNHARLAAVQAAIEGFSIDIQTDYLRMNRITHYDNSHFYAFIFTNVFQRKRM